MATELKVISFNVNGLRARLHQLAAVVAAHQPDIIALQETKVCDAEFPHAAVAELGYHAEIYGQKGHYGVALLSRQPPLCCIKGFPREREDAQKRLITARYRCGEEDIELINGYFPQGGSREHPTKFPAKRDFYAQLSTYLAERNPDRPLLLVGDMNVAPADLDVGIGADNVKRWLRSGKCCFLPEERGWLSTLLRWGLTDTFRQKFPEVDDRYSWFDYRSGGFDREPKRGLRIDLILATRSLQEHCREAGVDYGLRGMAKPSDHCPIWATFAL